MNQQQSGLPDVKLDAVTSKNGDHKMTSVVDEEHSGFALMKRWCSWKKDADFEKLFLNSKNTWSRSTQSLFQIWPSRWEWFGLCNCSLLLHLLRIIISCKYCFFVYPNYSLSQLESTIFVDVFSLVPVIVHAACCLFACWNLATICTANCCPNLLLFAYYYTVWLPSAYCSNFAYLNLVCCCIF